MRRPPNPTRRQVLAGSAAVTSGVTGLALPWITAFTAGCTPVEPPASPPDPLQPLLDAALTDVALANAVARSHPALTPAASVLASDRQAHADSLRAEMLRATPSQLLPSSASTPAKVAAEVLTDRAAAAAALAAATKAAQAQAGGLVAALPRYRAGLVASVAACCASHLAVLG